jgi:hypothetical protein
VDYGTGGIDNVGYTGVAQPMPHVSGQTGRVDGSGISGSADAEGWAEAPKEAADTYTAEEAAAADIEQPEAPADSESEAPALGDSMNTDGEVNEDAR